MKIRARFKGANASLGYIKGDDYELILTDNRIERVDGTGVCKYSSIEKFLQNWKIIAQYTL